MTRFGMKEKDSAELAGVMAEIILRNQAARDEVTRFRSRFLQMRYCLPDSYASSMVQELFNGVTGA